MEKINKRVVFLSIVGAYILIYFISIFKNNLGLTTLIKPGATLLAYYGLKNILKVDMTYDKTLTTMRSTFLFWVLADIASVIGEFLIYYGYWKFSGFSTVEAGFYFIIRVMILVSSIQFYFGLTIKSNKVQRFADIFIIVCCVMSSLWIIFNAKYQLESLNLILSFDIKQFFLEIYKIISMMTLGILLISWFHYQYRKITLGQRFVLLGIALIAGTDLAVEFHGVFINWIFIDIIYKIAIILVALGCEVFWLNPRRTLFITPKNEIERQEMWWRNLLYLFSYPLFVVMIVGFRPAIIRFLFLFAFYIVAFLYIKQLNITDQLLISEKEKNRKLKLYSNVVEQASLSIIITDVYGNIEYVNPNFVKTTGYTKEEVIGKNPSILKSDKTPPETFRKLWENLVNEKKWSGEFINVDKHGNEYEERAVISPIKGDDDRISYYVGINEDITESQKMKHIIDNQSQFIIQFADVIPSLIFNVSKDDIFVGANAEFKKVYQIDPALYQGIKFEDTPWMNSDKYKRFVEMREESIRTHMPVVRQVTINVNGKETPVLYCVNAYYTTDGVIGGYIGMLTDVSDLKEKEVELNNALVRANAATEAKSLFLANMSHEIRTPMNAIIGMAYLALKTELTDKQRDYLMKISDASSSLLRIINDILDFSKIESGKVKMEKVEFNLDQVIEKSVELLVQKARDKNLEFIYHVGSNIPMKLKGDPLRLGQIITNLVSNAVKFTENGEVAIDIIKKKQIDNYICLKFGIRDTGIGISKENQNHLFDEFTQSDNSITRRYGGTGLGLAICRYLVEMMDGGIWIESEVNVGSTFHFTAWFDIGDESPSKPNFELQNMKSIKTLIVDDNSAARDILKEYIENIGFAADIAESGSQAIDMIKRNDFENPYQLLFIDWKMPNLDGIETVKKISEMNFQKDKPSVVLVTAYDTEEMKKHAGDVNIDGFLSKPVSQSCLYDTIVNIFATTMKPAKDSVFIEKNYHIDGTNILLAEDNEINQQIACELLEGQGCKIHLANNGMEAVVMYQNNMDKYDMILMDIQMPEMDGFEATKRIREKSDEIPIIAMTARNMEDEKEKCFKAGMNDHISKPINPDILLLTVAKWRKNITKDEKLNIIKSDNISDSFEEERDGAIKIEGLKNINGIDVNIGLRNVGGNINLYMKLLHSFALNQQSTVNTIEKEYENQNYEKVERAVHLIKGVAGNIGATNIYDVSGEMEKIIYKGNEIVKIESLIKMLVLEFERVSNSINNSLKEEIKEIHKDEFLLEDKAEVIQNLIKLLENGDVSAVEYFEEYKALFQREISKKKFEKLAAKIEKYEFDDAISELIN